jgi:hypothetical protein
VANYTQQERGLSSYQLPGCIQKKIAGPSSTGGGSTSDGYPQMGSATSNGPGNSSSVSTPGNAPGSGSVSFNTSLSLPGYFATAILEDFTLPDLPEGATITAIKVYVTYAFGTIPPAVASDVSYGYVGDLGNIASSGSGTFTSPSLGTDASVLTGLIVQITIYASIFASGLGATGSCTAEILVEYDAPPWTGITYDRPVTEGNFLVASAVASTGTISSGTLTDSLGNTWTAVFSTGLAYQVWHTQSGASGNCAIGFPALVGAECALFEIYGVDTLDTIVTSGPVTTSNAPGFFGYLLNLGLANGAATPALAPSGWNAALEQANFNSPVVGADSSPYIVAQDRITRAGLTLPLASPFASGGAAFAVLAFKATTPNSFPFPLGDFIDKASFDQTRQQCRAYGLYGSLSMNSQSAGSDWLKSLFAAANAAPVYLGNKLYSIPYSEVSAAGNGALYTAPTASGPVAELNTSAGQGPYGDFMSDGTPESDPIDRIDSPNVLQLQIVCRENNYNQLVVTQPESATLSLYGMRKADPVVMNCVQDALIARMLLGIMVRRQQYIDNWKFTLSPRWMLLSPMDLVTITDTLAAIIGKPVRILSMEEQDDLSMVCSAEDFVYGACAPTPFTTSSPAPNGLNTGTTAGDITELIIFEPVPDLCAQQNQAQLWCVIGSNAENYGGCQVYVSTDGGASYDPAGDPVMGTAVMGVLSAVWLADTDPDTTNNLSLDMTLTAQPINSITAQQRDQFVLPCIVTGADIIVENNGTSVASFSLPSFENNGTLVCEKSLAWNYELMAYNDANLTGVNAYELMATGSGNELRRAVYSAPGSAGITHSAGEKFAVLNPNSLGIFKINLPSQWIGVPLYFKFLSFNSFGSALQSLSDVPAYSYTPTGVPY